MSVDMFRYLLKMGRRGGQTKKGCTWKGKISGIRDPRNAL